jgi:hypothetical protein
VAREDVEPTKSPRESLNGGDKPQVRKVFRQGGDAIAPRIAVIGATRSGVPRVTRLSDPR